MELIAHLTPMEVPGFWLAFAAGFAAGAAALAGIWKVQTRRTK
jgi:hypothetical protein